MSSPPAKIHLREAREQDIPLVVPMLMHAFRGRAMNEAFFPARLRVRQDDADQIAFRSAHIRKQFAIRDQAQSGQEHYIVAVLREDTDDNETIVGYAAWVDCNGSAAVSSSATTTTETAVSPSMPSSMDREAVDTAYKEIAVLENFLRKALGEQGFANSWSLDAIGVDPAHQRKGIGKMLMQYGAERAEKDGKNIRFMASASGAKMYWALGYEEVGSHEILGEMEYAFVQRVRK